MDFSGIGSILFCLLVALDWGFISAKRCPTPILPNGRARLRSRGRTVQFRCRRGFTRVGSKMAICLKTQQWSLKPPLCLGKGCPHLPLPPTLNATMLYGGGMAHFTCAPGYTRQGLQQIYCNGKEWSAEPPKCQAGMSLGCDFEKTGLCGWSQELEDDDMDWTRIKGTTPTKGTGPSADHTLGTSKGHYLFIEASAPSRKGHYAHLISPKYSPSDVNGVCMDFYYHMFGSGVSGDMGSLEVFLKPNRVPLNRLRISNDTMSLFQMDGNQGDEWHHHEIEIPSVDEPFQFVFEGKKQASWLSDIAIDDIRLYNCTNNNTNIITSPTEKPDTVHTTAAMPALPETKTSMRTPPSTTHKRPIVSAATATLQPSTRRRTPATSTKATTRRRRTATTTTTLKPTTRRKRTTTTTSKPTTRRIRATTTTLKPTTRRIRTTTTTLKPTTRRIRTTTTTLKPTTRRIRTTTTTLQPITKRRITTTTQKQATGRHRTTTTTTTTTIYQKKWTRRRTTTTSTPKMKNSSRSKPPPTPPAFQPARTTTWAPHKTTPQPPSSSFLDSSDPTPNENATMEAPSQATKRSVTTTIKVNHETVQPTLETSSSDNNYTTGGEVGVGKSKKRPGSSAPGSMQLIPLIAGVAGAVVLVAMVVAVLAYKWSKKQRMKEEKDMDDQMNIITDYVETSLGS